MACPTNIRLILPYNWEEEGLAYQLALEMTNTAQLGGLEHELGSYLSDKFPGTAPAAGLWALEGPQCNWTVTRTSTEVPG